MNVENLAKMRAMQYARDFGNPRLVDMALTDPDRDPELTSKVKRIQFDAPQEMSARLDQVANMLDVSRREFLESALGDALDRAEGVFFTTFKEVAGYAFGDHHDQKAGA